MPDFSKRSYTKELLDMPGIPFKDIQQNMKELNTVNTLLGGHSITLHGFKTLLGNRKKISVCEIGCGGGDNLYVIYRWCLQNHIHVSVTGIDMNAACIAFAEKKYGTLGISFICSDYKDVVFNEQPDIVFNSLFCHHFTNEALLGVLQWMHRNSSLGFFINDLHRHPIAYYTIKFITRIVSRSYLVKNDAPLSVLRGFTNNDWQHLFQKAGIRYNAIKWQWAFRHLIIVKN